MNFNLIIYMEKYFKIFFSFQCQTHFSFIPHYLLIIVLALNFYLVSGFFISFKFFINNEVLCIFYTFLFVLFFSNRTYCTVVDLVVLQEGFYITTRVSILGIRNCTLLNFVRKMFSV